MLARACVAQNVFTEELFVCDSCLCSVEISMPLLLAEWQTGSPFFEAQCCRTDLLTFEHFEIKWQVSVVPFLHI